MFMQRLVTHSSANQHANKTSNIGAITHAGEHADTLALRALTPPRL